MLPLKDTIPARSFPVVNWLLIAANVVLFLVELSLGPDAEALIAALGVVPARLLTSPTPDQLATLVTSMFLHGGWLHLLSNMLALYIFGDNVEDRLGHGGYALFYARTNNPYDLSHTCGGSSGGAAAIVAAGGSPFDIGSDTGGSLRVPSHCCGTATIRPTSGRVPRTGNILPPAGVMDALTQIGPVARYVEDLAVILPIIAGVDWHDPAIVPMKLGDPKQVDLKTLRVAVHTDNGIASPTSETVKTVQAAADALARAGRAVHLARPAPIKQTLDLFLGLFAADGGAGIRMLLQMYGTTESSPRYRASLN